jgi:tetratricopeptide (TPR) repeat protein
MSDTEKPIDIDTFWEYSDPVLSEERFRSALASAQGDDRLELLTQIARTYSLRGRFGEAHETLNNIEQQLAAAGQRPYIRYLLERGRAYNSAGEVDKARDQFNRAWEQALAAHLDGLAVDAAHMLAITYSNTPEAIGWNQRGIEFARQSDDRKAQSLLPAMLNNCAWDLHGLGRFDEALQMFEAAQAEWIARDKPEQIQIAKWSVARCLRSLGRYQDALIIQRMLEAEHASAGTVDGYVFEEIAENLFALGQINDAKPYFRKAADELGKDEWFVAHEAGRLAQLILRSS